MRYVRFCGSKFAGDAVPGIVIALKRNGAYAGDIQVQQLGGPSCLKVECIVSPKLLIKTSATVVKKYG